MIRSLEMLNRMQAKTGDSSERSSRRNSRIGTHRASESHGRTSIVLGMLRQMNALVGSKIKDWVSPLDRFRRVARLILMCVSWCRFSFQRAEQNKEQLLSVTQLGDEPKIQGGESLLFDLSQFKLRQEQKIPVEARRILQLHTHTRSDNEIKYVQIALKNIKAFSEYPMRMQQRLCKVGWYEGYEGRRAIVRQGHPPHAFYFILSGTVVVTVLDSETHVNKTICFLNRGMEFGELALVSKSIRQATVVSKTTVELLVISEEDFEEIFMSGGMKNVNDPDHNTFIKNINFLSQFPLDKLGEDPNKCLFHYFNRGQVLVRDSTLSDWIYIVKSGSLSVMKKLKAMDSTCKKAHDNKQADRKYSKINSEIEFKNKGFLNFVPNIKIGHHQSHTHPLNSKRRQISRNLPPIKAQRHRDNVSPFREMIGKEQIVLRQPIVTKTNKGVYFTSRNYEKRKRRKVNDFQKGLDEQSRLRDTYHDKESNDYGNVVGRKTIADDLERNVTIDQTVTSADLHPTFIQVQVLERGQYFGLSSLLFDDQPSFSLVSNGADCFLISKKLFMEYTSDQVVGCLRKTEVPYPSQADLQVNLQNYLSWEEHRSKTYNTAVKRIQDRLVAKQQYTRQYAGQYNHRTGTL